MMSTKLFMATKSTKPTKRGCCFLAGALRRASTLNIFGGLVDFVAINEKAGN